MSKKKAAAPEAPVTSQQLVQQQTIQNPEALPQTTQEPVISQEQTDNLITKLMESANSGTITNQVPTTNPELVINQETESSTEETNQETQINLEPIQQPQPNENQPEAKKAELTFEEKVKLRAISRNAARSANKFKDALLSLINPDKTDDNPDRA